jgi:hypothetical protein
MQYKIVLIKTLYFVVSRHLCLTFLEMKLVLELSFRYFMFWVWMKVLYFKKTYELPEDGQEQAKACQSND